MQANLQTFNPQAAQASMTAPAPEKKKKKTSRAPWPTSRFEIFTKNLVETIHLIGKSFTGPPRPGDVPRDAPCESDYTALRQRLMRLVPVYHKLLAKRSKIGKKPHSGGLDMPQYFRKEWRDFFNSSGVLPPHLHIPLYPDSEPGKELGVFNRALFTSIFTAYHYQEGLAHPEQARYIMINKPLLDLIGLEQLKVIAATPPKKPKKKKAGARKAPPSGPKLAMLVRKPGEKPQLHMRHEMIPAVCNVAVLGVPPRNCPPEILHQIAAIRVHLKKLTDQRNAAKKAKLKAEREAKKAEQTMNSVRPVQVLSLNIPGGSVPEVSSINIEGLN